MSYIDRLIGDAGDFLRATSKPTVGAAKDAVPSDLFERHMFESLVAEAPALRDLIKDLNQKWAHTDAMTQDVLLDFWQSSPVVRQIREMDPAYLANHAVATDIDTSPETAEMRGFTKHDRYSSAMATIAVGDKIRETLEHLPEDLEKAAAEAEQKQQEADKALQDLADALAELMAALGLAPGGGPAPMQPGGPGAGAEGPQMEDGSFLTSELSLEDALAEAALIEALAEALADAGAQEQAVNEALGKALDAAEARQIALAGPIREGIENAIEDAVAEQRLLNAWSVEEGVLEKMSFQERRNLINALRNTKIHDFLDLVGRFKMMVASELTHHTQYGRDEVVDTELSGRFEDFLGSEQAKMATHPMLKLDVLARLADEAVLSRNYHGIEKVGKGSLVFVGDVSGTMKQKDIHGVTRDAWLKAFMMALLFQAKRQNRDFVVILFSAAAQQKMWTFKKGQCTIGELIEVVEFFWNGGTNFMRPLDMAAKVIEDDYNLPGSLQADLIFVTDGIAPIEPEWLEKWNVLKDRVGFRTWGIAVGMPVTDAVHAVSNDARSIEEFVEPRDLADLVRQL